MNRNTLHKSLFIIITLLLSGTLISYAQTEVNGALVKYARIDSIHALDKNNVDSLFVDSSAGFSVGDTVLVYQSIGANPNGPEDSGSGEVQDLYHTGKYSIVKIQEIVNKLVILNTILPNFYQYQMGESGQMVKVISYDKAGLSSSFDFPSWDPLTRKGGIFPIIAGKKLILDADIKADGKGFHGAVPEGDYAGACSSVDTAFRQKYYILASDTAGLKGEGIASPFFPWKYGYGFSANAGGGGSGKFSGGGGGGNAGQGGKGGNESSSCPNAGDLGGEGGRLQGSFFSNNPVEFGYNRLFFGGGGGTGTLDNGNNRLATAGGNGGGIIIIIADTLVGNGHILSSNGISVAGTASAGAGGGGAGGTLVLDVNHYIGNLSLEVKGGKGGNAASTPDTTGPGGGGGGGVIWHNMTTLPGNVSKIIAPGDRGIVAGQITGSASSGSPGIVINNLKVPVNGFILNFMPDAQTVCEGIVPDPLMASPARGGSGSFTYKWLKSTGTFITWEDADGINTGITYQPAALSQTTRFKRVVNDGVLRDTSFYVTIHVHPKIENNDFIVSDTVCQFDSPGTLVPAGTIAGGSGPYNYRWTESPDTQSWTDASGIFSQSSYSVPSLADTIYYRRIVYSGTCTDTSNLITINVLGQVSNNLIGASQEVCHNQVPDPLTGSAPVGGLPGDKRYLWQFNEGSAWVNSVTSSDFSPSALSNGSYEYRRIVFSGQSNECIDTSNIATIISWPTVTNNDLINNDSTICAGLPSVLLSGTQPGQGSGNYKYVWETGNTSSGPWLAAEAVFTNTPYQPGSLNNSKWFRRVVYSGADDACSNTSSVIKLNVLPEISGNNISSNQLVCEGIVPQPLEGGIISGGNGSGSYSYNWQIRNFGNQDYNDVPETGTEAIYNTPTLSDSSEFRRIITSGPYSTCKDTSNSILISVLPRIENNTIQGPLLKEVCLEENVSLQAGEISGGIGIADYTWEVSTNGADWTDAPGNNNFSIYTSEMLLSPMYFRRLAQSSVCSDVSEPVFADTLSLPQLTSMELSADSVCHLEKGFHIRLSIKDGAPAYSVALNNGIDGSDIQTTGLSPIDSVYFSTFPSARLDYNFTISSITDMKGCSAKVGNIAPFNRKLALFPDAVPVILLDENTKICDNQLNINANKDIADDFWWTIDNQGILIAEPDKLNTVAQVPADFDKRQGWLKFHATSPGCKSISGYKPSVDSVSITFYEQPDPFLIGEESDIVYLIDHYWVKHSAPSAGNLVWDVATGGGQISSITSDSSLFISIPKDQLCRYIGTLSNGPCNVSSDEITLERKEVHVYEGISPGNQDGINDYLVAEGLDNEEVRFEFQIFSNSGLLVRSIKNQDIEKLGLKTGLADNGLVLWDGKGTDEQTFVPSGIYYFVLLIDYKDQKFTKKGFVVVKK